MNNAAHTERLTAITLDVANTQNADDMETMFVEGVVWEMWERHGFATDAAFNRSHFRSTLAALRDEYSDDANLVNAAAVAYVLG